MVPADVAWMIVATALVLLMTPALAFFYGGLVRSKNALNTMMMSFVSLGVISNTSAVATIIHATSAGTITYPPDRRAVSSTTRPVRRCAGPTGPNYRQERTARAAFRATIILEMSAIIERDGNTVNSIV